jgi:hypothetical protein
MKKKTTLRFHGFQPSPIWQWSNASSHQRPSLTWIRYGNGKGLVPNHMAKAIQQHNEFCDKRDAFIARCLEALGILPPIALIALVIFLAVR